MGTNIDLDNELLGKAQEFSGLRTKKDVVHHALAEYVRREEQRKVILLFGTIEYEPDYNYKRERKGR